MGYNEGMQKISRRRLRSATVQLGALTALALTLTACDRKKDDDCALGPVGGGEAVAVALQAPVVSAAGAAIQATAAGTAAQTTVAVPAQGGFGTHLAACGGGSGG